MTMQWILTDATQRRRCYKHLETLRLFPWKCDFEWLDNQCEKFVQVVCLHLLNKNNIYNQLQNHRQVSHCISDIPLVSELLETFALEMQTILSRASMDSTRLLDRPRTAMDCITNTHHQNNVPQKRSTTDKKRRRSIVNPPLLYPI